MDFGTTLFAGLNVLVYILLAGSGYWLAPRPAACTACSSTWCHWWAPLESVSSCTRFSGFSTISSFGSNRLSSKLVSMLFRIVPMFVLKDFVRDRFVSSSRRYAPKCACAPEFAHICAAKQSGTKSLGKNIVTIPNNMPTNFELKRLKPKLDIAKKPENRVHELTDSNVYRNDL